MNLSSLTFIIASFESFLKTIFNNFVNFMEKMLFESYMISSNNNGIYAEQFIKYVENNMLSWQTKSYLFQPDFNKSGKVISSQKLLLNTGLYFFWFNNILFWISIDFKDNPYIGLRTEANQTTFNIKVTCFRWNIKDLQGLFIQVDETTNKNKGAALYNFLGLGPAGWERVIAMPKRKLETVIIPESKKDSLIDDISNFFSEKAKIHYENKGINYKRGILLYGPPGCGKTSLIASLSHHFNMDVYNISLENPYMNEDALLRSLSMIPSKSIVLFEDIDVAFPVPRVNDNKEDGSGSNNKSNNIMGLNAKMCNVTMKGFLNAIDGIKSNNNGILFLFTTNHIKKLDPALIRPGRIDFKCHLTYLEEAEIIKMFKLYYELDTDSCTLVLNKFSNKKNIVPADLSGFLLENTHLTLEELLLEVDNREWSQQEVLEADSKNKVSDDDIDIDMLKASVVQNALSRLRFQT